MVEESVRKTAAKKTVRKAVGRTAAVTRAPRTKKVADEEIESTPVTRPRRKAPTAVPMTTEMRSNNARMMQIGIGVFMLMVFIGAGIGFTDRGIINVKSIIETRISAASPEERVRLIQAQNATANNVVDGGLIASGVPENIPPPTSTTTSDTASTSEATASSTATGVASSTEESVSPSSNDVLVPVETQS